MDISNKLLLAGLGIFKQEDVIQEALEEYSTKVAKAIQPISNVTAPIIVAVLREYAEEIEKINPEIKNVVEQLMKLPHMVISTDIPDQMKRGNL
ncbi:hypothetical protein SDC9_161281 [bioreactor metagenome]|uniref:Uncharacterized protein n=1 Tax=bioreactor metagenome TaxID=1076179 RepID=A0A645FHP9_9ZZZZ